MNMDIAISLSEQRKAGVAIELYRQAPDHAACKKLSKNDQRNEIDHKPSHLSSDVTHDIIVFLSQRGDSNDNGMAALLLSIISNTISNVAHRQAYGQAEQVLPKVILEERVALTQLRNEVPIGYNGTPKFIPETVPCPSTITTPV